MTLMKAFALKTAAVATLAFGGLAAAPTAASAAIEHCPSVHYTSTGGGTGESAMCYNTNGTIHFLTGSLMRIKITCERAGYTNKVYYGPYSSYYSPESCQAQYYVIAYYSLEYIGAQ